jgi:alanyl-tRNA synthetase
VQDAVTDQINELLAAAPKVGDTTVFVAEMPDVPIDQLKTGADMIKQKCGSAAVLFGVAVGPVSNRSDDDGGKSAGGKALLLAAMSNDLVKRGIKAGDLIKEIAKLIDGGGGGPPTMAQAGGKDPSKIPEALEAGKAWIEQKL